MSKFNIKQIRVMTYFIEATEELILEEGVEGVSINKVAKRAGYNSATIYNYFDSIEHLILYASINYLREYVNDLKSKVDENENALEIYKTIYEVFNIHSFKSPEIFYNMFFGKYSYILGDIIEEYYQIFPQDLEGQSSLIKSMLSQGDMRKRDERLVEKLVEEGFIKEENKEVVQQIVTRLQQSHMHQSLIEGEKFDFEKNNKEFFESLDFIIKSA